MRRHGSSMVAGWTLGTLMLAGCGGGGSSSTTLEPAPGTTFPLGAAVVQLYTTGYQKTASVSGTAVYAGTSFPVSGSVSLALGPAGSTTTTFAGQTALSASSSVSGTIAVAGQSIDISSSAQEYLTTSYAPLGYTSSVAYCVAPTPGVYPAQVSVGQAGTVVTYACYTDSSMSVATGTQTLSYVVKAAGSATAVMVSLVDTFVNTAGQQTVAGSSSYLLDAAGGLALSSITAQQSDAGVLLDLTFTVQ